MKTTVKCAMILLLATGFLLSVEGCGTKSRSKPKRAKNKKVKTEKKKPDTRFTVVQVDAETRVIRVSELDSLRFELRSAHKEALNQYNKEKREALKNNTAFEKPKPVKPKLRISKKRFETEEEADEYRGTLLAKKKTKKPKPAPVKPPASGT